MAILSIQSHVAYGYVGNKAATYPLQALGYDVWPVNTVQFSNHTGYKKWQGEIFPRKHIKEVILGLEELEVINKCQAILSGYMGSSEICEEVQDTVNRFKKKNENLIYLCDPVIGNTSCYVRPEVLEFFKKKLKADIITPNQFEAEILSGIKIIDKNSIKIIAQKFHSLGIKIVIITGIKFTNDTPDHSYTFISNGKSNYMIKTQEHSFSMPISGTGDLFSALYLGYYLSSKEPITALQKTVTSVDQAVRNTLQSQERELQVLSVDYKMLKSPLPELEQVN
ncbi:MAG: pyridoxal kinase [Rickettsiales bacterium]|nr:pyridoxal kinase [Rickettsiales bacterium]